MSRTGGFTSPPTSASRPPSRCRPWAASWPSSCAPGTWSSWPGPLGGGKPRLVQGIGAGLGARGPFPSPTFVIARVHPSLSGTGPALVHADAYRLGRIEGVDDLDLDTDVATA